MNRPSAAPNPIPSLTRPQPAALRAPPRPHLQPPTITLTSPSGAEREMRSGRRIDIENSNALQADQSTVPQQVKSRVATQEPRQNKRDICLSLSGKWICGLAVVLALVPAGGISAVMICVNRTLEGADLRHGLLVG